MAKAALLLVDDDEMSSQILSYILADEGYEVDMAATGGAAVEKVAVKDYNLILLDYILPDMRGHDVAKKLRVLKPDVKIVLLTGYSKNGETAETSYLRVMLKPVPPEEIVRTIAELLG